MPILRLNEALAPALNVLKEQGYRLEKHRISEFRSRFDPMIVEAKKRADLLKQERKQRDLTIDERHELRIHVVNAILIRLYRELLARSR